MLLALATCSGLPAHETDDLAFHAALESRGVALERPAWDDPSVDWSRFDGVLVRTTWNYQHRVDEFRAWADRIAALTRLDNAASVLRWNSHKSYLRELGAAGVPVVPTIWLDRGSRPDVASLTTVVGGTEGFLKPCVGATAQGTLRFHFDNVGVGRAQELVDERIAREDYMLQPVLANVLSRGEWSAMVFDGELSHCVRKIPVPGDYRVQDDHGGRDEPYEPTGAEREHVHRVLAVAERILAEHLGGRRLLYARVDFLWRDDGSCVLVELELIEPALFFRHSPAAAERLAEAWLARLAR
ncbi:MAG: hypothetical protein NXI31_01990 [bacterium]|nr:hypothetical protein [bacterium]